MAISKRKITLMAISLFALVGISQIVLESYVDARAGGGRSGGFRGSRSYHLPANPVNRLNRGEMRLPHRSNLVHSHRNPAALCAPLAPPCWAVFWARCSSRDWPMRVLAALAGLAAVASALLRSFCSPAWDIFFTANLFVPPAATGSGTMQYQNTRDYSPQYTPVQEAPALNNDIDYRSLTMMDRSFDPNQASKRLKIYFSKFRARGTSRIRPLCVPYADPS